jgi:prepilin-type N-terminal cleavage/methylation domain-containing protein
MQKDQIIQMSQKNFKKAYSLIELSIVIIIISILITGALSVSVSGVNNAKIKTTNDRMKEVYRAMGNFLVANKRLPCPASILKVKTADADYGTEVGGGSGCVGAGVYQSDTVGTLFYGMVPTKTLGISSDMAEDGFESKFAYIIDSDFTNNLDATPSFTSPTFGTAPYTSIITINEKPAGTVRVATADAIMAIVSYGSNKFGAFNANSSTQNERSGDADELNNDATSFTSSPYRATFNATLVTSSGNSDTFDDIVLFKRRNDFVEDFNAMFLIPCQDAGSSFGNVNAYYGNIVYATSSCGTPNEDKRLTKKCEAYGSWANVVAACP